MTEQSRDDVYSEAAQKILQADVLLLCTGAGFSADSGLAVYADVAQVDAYARRRLQYHDICDPSWLDVEPELFWGFWGQCFNDYRNTTPHEGYEIINSWAERHFRDSAFAKKLSARLESAKNSKDGEDLRVPYKVCDHAGAFFAFTSNVDAHHFDWFRACEIRECHGNVELYQCAGRCSGVWRAPLHFRFQVDKSSMMAASGPVSPSFTMEDCSTDQGLENVSEVCMPARNFQAYRKPRIGNVQESRRPSTLRHMPGTAPNAEEVGFTDNHPKCPRCAGPARPAILMFGDWSWQDFDEQEERWLDWIHAVSQEIRASPTPVRTVVLELGAGNRVPTVRETSENQLLQWQKLGADVQLVRINPDLPFTRKGKLKSHCISIQDVALASLKKINAAMNDITGNMSECGKLVERTRADERATEEHASNKNWDEMKTMFDEKGAGGQMSISDAYACMFTAEEKAAYLEDQFTIDLKSLRKLSGKDEDSLLSEDVTWPEIKCFFEAFAHDV